MFKINRMHFAEHWQLVWCSPLSKAAPCSLASTTMLVTTIPFTLEWLLLLGDCLLFSRVSTDFYLKFRHGRVGIKSTSENFNCSLLLWSVLRFVFKFGRWYLLNCSELCCSDCPTLPWAVLKYFKVSYRKELVFWELCLESLSLEQSLLIAVNPRSRFFI